MDTPRILSGNTIQGRILLENPHPPKKNKKKQKKKRELSIVHFDIKFTSQGRSNLIASFSAKPTNYHR